MKTRPGWVILLIEIASISTLVFLLNQASLPARIGIILVFLQPIFKINAIPLVANVLISLGAFDYRGGYSFFGIRAWLAFLCILAFNALFHIRGAIQTKRYSPGLVAWVVLYLPLTILSFTYFLKMSMVDIFSAIICAAIGSSFQSVLDYLKKRGLKKEGQPFKGFAILACRRVALPG